MNSNTPAKDSRNNNSPCEESGEWVITLYEPYHLPAKPPYHLPPEPKEDGDEGEGWVLTIYEPYCLPAKILGQDSP